MTPVVSWCIHRYQTVAISLGYQACFLHSKKSSWSSKSESLLPQNG